MGSIGSVEMCPACNHESLQTEFYYKTGEEWASCTKCGHGYSVFIKRSKLGNIVRRDKTKPINSENMFWVERKTSPRYGLAAVHKNGGCGIYLLHNKKEYNFFNDYPKNDDGVDAVVLSRLEKGIIVRRVTYLREGIDEQNLCFA